jgi:hypothetical protein
MGPKHQKTALEKLQEDMERYLAPLRQGEEMQDLIRKASPGYQMKELLKQYEPNWQLREIAGQLTISRHAQEILDSSSVGAQAQRMLERYLPKKPLGWDGDALRKAASLDSISKAVTAYERYLKPVTEHQEWFEKLQRQALGGLSMQDFTRQLEQANPTLSAIDAAKRSLDNMLGTFREIDFSKLELGEEDEREAEQVVQAITQTSTAEPTLQAAVDQFIEVIQEQRNPVVQLMLWSFFKKVMDWIIAGIIGTVISQYMPQIGPQSPQEATKSVKEVARIVGASPNLLVEYRFVSAKVIILRQNPKARSPEVGRLTFGKLVKLVKKDKDFALVLWRDQESGAEIQGWVFARYLQRFD